MFLRTCFCDPSQGCTECSLSLTLHLLLVLIFCWCFYPPEIDLFEWHASRCQPGHKISKFIRNCLDRKGRSPQTGISVSLVSRERWLVDIELSRHPLPRGTPDRQRPVLRNSQEDTQTLPFLLMICFQAESELHLDVLAEHINTHISF